MTRFPGLLAGFAIAASWALAADPVGPSISKIYDQQLRGVEREVVSLAEAMPADKYSFAPTNGEFSGVRTFSQQMSHIAAIVYLVSSSILEEPNPSETGKSENGPASLQNKEQVVKYLQDAFAYAHKAMANLNDHNLTDQVKSPFGNGKTARAGMATEAIAHSFDHYGQAVVYARMNGIVPPASRKR